MSSGAQTRRKDDVINTLESSGPEIRRRKVRRSAILFGLIAAAFYFAFIVMSILRARS
jgi:hypothetical protein